MIDKDKLQYGDELVWLASSRRKKDMRVRVLDITDKRIVVCVLGEGWDTCKKYYVSESWVRELSAN